MSEESIKKFTKKHRKSEREKKGLKGKKGRKSGTAENSNDCYEDLQRPEAAPSITELELTKDSTLTRRAGDQLSSTPPDTSRKRKQRDCDAILDEPVNFVTDAEIEPQKNEKRDEHRKEDRVVSGIENVIGF